MLYSDLQGNLIKFSKDSMPNFTQIVKSRNWIQTKVYLSLKSRNTIKWEFPLVQFWHFSYVPYFLHLIHNQNTTAIPAYPIPFLYMHDLPAVLGLVPAPAKDVAQIR